MQLLATACALGSGVGMAMVNLVFGEFVTLIVAYSSGKLDPSTFRSDAGRLGYGMQFDPGAYALVKEG